VRLITRPLRLARIMFVLMRYNIDAVVLGKHWFFPLRLIVFFNPFYWTTGRRLPNAERIRLAIEELGPIFVKAGQIASTRRDLIPDDVAKELAKLQDRVPPFSGAKAKKIIEKTLKQGIETVFSEFDTQALASASIAQVHAATLKNNERVVIKVLRPNIQSIIERDVDLLMILAKIAERYWYPAKHLKPVQIMEEIGQTLFDELDLLREGANASQLRRNFSHSSMLYIPKIYWEFSHASMLVIERIHGIPIHDIERLHDSGVNMKKLAERCIEIFFTQVFRDSFFHADLHPGNLFVSEKDPENPTLIAVDFGIAGSLNQHDQRYLAENMIAFFKRDYQRVAELHIACGWLPPETRIDQFEGAIRRVSEPIFEMPLSQISFGQLLLRLFQVARRFHINIQPQLVLLQKTLLSIESLSRSLAPELDIWSSASPQIEKWLKKQVGFGAFFRRIRNNLPRWSEQLPEIPSLIHEVLEETKLRREKQRFAESANHRLEIARREKQAKITYFLGGAAIATAIGSFALYLI